jgi:hypothetical protein
MRHGNFTMMTDRKRSGSRLPDGPIECIDEVMAEIYRQKTVQERVKIVSAMYTSVRRQITAILRCQHPDWDEAKINKEVIRRLSHANKNPFDIPGINMKATTQEILDEFQNTR